MPFSLSAAAHSAVSKRSGADQAGGDKRPSKVPRAGVALAAIICLSLSALREK